ncbi:MAG: hypothetical protein OEW67_01985 [Cyclobacteriaceae bacterium]|nr:hypothetical protein [Cyclobacteriaceae bacterium]
MKKILLILFSASIIMSCDEFDIADQGIVLEELPSYVAFNANGTEAYLDTVFTDENGGSATFNVEAPTGTLSDITVNYEFSGTAIFGTDFNVAGASAAGGSLVITHDPADFLDFDNKDLDISLLTDAIVDGEKTLNINLISASNAEGQIAVGRGGTDYLKSAVLVIADVD